MSKPTIVTQPVQEPITLAIARGHLNLDVDPLASDGSHPDDWKLQQIYIPAARAACENFCNLSIARQVLRVSGQGYGPCARALALPQGPVTAIVEFRYIDADGAAQVLPPDQYVLDTDSTVASVVPAYGVSWPGLRHGPGAVRVDYWAGYGAPGNSDGLPVLPAPVLAAMLLKLGHLYENREEVLVGATAMALPLAAQSLLEPYRVQMGV